MSAEKRVAFGPTSKPVRTDNEKIASTSILSTQGDIFIESKRNRKRSWKERLLLQKTIYTVTIVDRAKQPPVGKANQPNPYTTQIEAYSMRDATILGFYKIAKARKKAMKLVPA